MTEPSICRNCGYEKGPNEDHCSDCEAEVQADLDQHVCKRDESWAEYDAQGIYLCRVCPECRDAKLSRYRPEILTGYSQADVDEPIEPEDDIGGEW